MRWASAFAEASARQALRRSFSFPTQAALSLTAAGVDRVRLGWGTRVLDLFRGFHRGLFSNLRPGYLGRLRRGA
jgi:hypothetical protein